MTTSEQGLQRLLLQQEVDQLNAAYAAALDEKRFEAWPDFFVEDGRYKVQARENFDRGLPLALMALESRGMMKDRVYGVTQTIYHGPYYMRHIIGAARVVSQEGEVIKAEANYAVFRTKPGSVSEVYNVGRYIDELIKKDGLLKFRSRLCVYDSEMILNSLIYPV
ncbi:MULTISPECIES: aromatic-ring-hydroxylating dioxygenase subunit beta [unclassified Polaromonas]|uniref:aromatic-ring-hydroxylating dioxygenase subunit beta n=1 Tax=unclassified Polaromonas TaxID=2638319 RepID=UPI000F0780DC|nr:MULTISPECIES: aromatic-ring-hydroxylating dioxygenase subunit beta [unclassified Polaromonas]AYQ29047.1 salicylate hydroxylase [Polaromonas sp. SP1]QGJ19835.1 salicylate hydroxylase [Polaromonas sp. Pch-P]